MTGAFDEKDTVIWYVNDKSTGSQDIPKQLAVGEYKVRLVVKRDNYNDFDKTVTAKISNAKINLAVAVKINSFPASISACVISTLVSSPVYLSKDITCDAFARYTLYGATAFSAFITSTFLSS